MPVPNRLPSLEDSLQTLLDMGVPITTVLDVGVLDGTYPLKKAFPHLTHHLFEPVEHFFPRIKKGYQDLDHRIHHVALSDRNGKAWQVLVSAQHDGVVSHSQLRNEPVEVKNNVVGCEPVEKSRLDDYLPSTGAVPPFVLKVDVDGQEIPILEGASETLKDSNVVIVEATIMNISERIGFLERHGFQIFDIVELAYYAGAFWQADFVFINKKVVDENRNTVPMASRRALDWNMWYDYSRNKCRRREK
jgi:FkbM family methyltransferase